MRPSREIRSRYARSDQPGALRVNTPDGFPSGTDPVWWWGTDFITPTAPGTLSAVTRASSLITQTISSLPWRLLSGGLSPQTSIIELAPPRWLFDPMLSRQDNRFGLSPTAAAITMPRSLFYGQWLRAALMRGVGPIIFEEGSDGAPVAGTFKLLNPDLVAPMWTQQDGHCRRIGSEHGGGYVDTDYSGRFLLGSRVYRLVELLNPTGAVDDMGRTKGVLETHALELGMASQAVTYGNGMFRSGVPSGVLSVTTPNYKKEQADALKASWMEAHGGDRRSVAVLNATTSFQPLGLSPLDMALIESRKFSLIDIANAFGVPAYMLGGADGGSNTYCASTDTEILTSDGWKRYDEVSVGDSVLTLDTAVMASEWQPVEAVNVFDGPHEVTRLESRTHSSVTTAGHRWPVIRYGESSVTWVTTATMQPKDRILAAAPLKSYPLEPKWSDAYVELIAWAFTEGHIREEGSIVLAQSASYSPENCVRIRRALTEVFGPSEGIHVRNRPYWREQPGTPVHWRINKMASAQLLPNMPDKVPGLDFLTQLTKAQLLLFIETAIEADGCTTKNGSRVFVQKDRRRSEALQLACQLAGLSGQLRQNKAGMWQFIISQRELRKPKAHKANISEDVIDGPVWCPTTANGTWLARRGHAIYFTGNSNAESRNRDFLSYSLMPWANAVEDVLTALTPQGQFIEVNFNGLLRTDLKTRVESYSIALRDGWMLPAEVRLLESMGPMEESTQGNPFGLDQGAAPADPHADAAVQGGQP